MRSRWISSATATRLARKHHLDTTPPSVSWQAPSSGSTVSGTLSGSSCLASAGDNAGVSKVSFYVDGTVGVTDTASPYNCSIDTTALTNGSHTLKAVAYDAAGNSSSASETVSVSNSTSTPTPTPVPTPTPTPTPTLTPSWDGDFSTDDWSQYDDCRSHHMDGVYPTYYTAVRATSSLPIGTYSCSSTGALPNQEIGSTPPGFNYAAKFTVDSSSTTGAAGQRTLDTLWPQTDPTTGKSKAYQGATTWYRDEVMFPADFKPIPDDDWNWTYVIHNWPDNFGDDDLSCGIDTTNSTNRGPFTDGGGTGERLSCRMLGGGSPTNPIDAKSSSGSRLYGSGNWYTNPDVRYTYPIGVRQIQRGHWYDNVFRIKWSWKQDSLNGCTDASSTTGCFEWWVDGVKVASWSGPTLLYYADNNSDVSGATPGAGQGYLDHGYYRSTSGTWKASVYHGATMIGPTSASIGEGGF